MLYLRLNPILVQQDGMYSLYTVYKHIAMLTLDPGTIIAVNNRRGGGGTKAEAALPQVLMM